MAHIRTREYFESGVTLSITCSCQTNVLLMDDDNYAFFNKNDETPNGWLGGFSKSFPYTITIPSSCYWNIVFSLPNSLRASDFDYSINKY